MDAIADGSVALVVTSPPYFAGKQYEEELEREGVPSSYLEYLELLTDVFAECVAQARARRAHRRQRRQPRAQAVPQPVGRRHPHPRGRPRAAAARRADLAEGRGRQRLVRVGLVPQRGQPGAARPHRAGDRRQQGPVRPGPHASGSAAAEGLPHASTLTTDDFMALTLDVWSIPPESARRVGHPAPFPVELPEQLIRLYTFEDDLVLDPFMGSGSALVAAARLGRRYVGYDLDAGYVELARRRVDEALARSRPTPATAAARGDDGAAARRSPSRSWRGRVHDRGRRRRMPRHRRHGRLVATDADGRRWFFDVAGAVHHPPRRAAARRHRVAGARPGRRPARRAARRAVGAPHHRPPRRPERRRHGPAGGRPEQVFDVIGLLSQRPRPIEALRQRLYATVRSRGSGRPPTWTACRWHRDQRVQLTAPHDTIP